MSDLIEALSQLRETLSPDVSQSAMWMRVKNLAIEAESLAQSRGALLEALVEEPRSKEVIERLCRRLTCYTDGRTRRIDQIGLSRLMERHATPEPIREVVQQVSPAAHRTPDDREDGTATERLVQLAHHEYPGEHVYFDEHDMVVAHGWDETATLAGCSARSGPPASAFLFHVPPSTSAHGPFVSRPRGQHR